MPQPPFVRRPSTSRRIANILALMTSKLNEAWSAIGLSRGTVWYVSNVTGENGADDTGHGKSRSLPFATLVYALTQVAAGDTIICGEGHAESVPSAAAVAMTVARVHVKGEGSGSTRPTFTWDTATTATWTISAAGCRVTNCHFVMAFTGLVSGFVVSAAGVKIDGNTFVLGTAGASNVPVVNPILTTAAADYLEVSDNYFLAPATTPGGSIVASTGCCNVVGTTGFRFLRNYCQYWGTTTSGAVNNATTAAQAYQIADNVIINNTASATKGVVMHASSIGMTHNNRFGIGSGAAPITSAAGHWAGNWSAAAVATNGTLV